MLEFYLNRRGLSPDLQKNCSHFEQLQVSSNIVELIWQIFVIAVLWKCVWLYINIIWQTPLSRAT